MLARFFILCLMHFVVSEVGFSQNSEPNVSGGEAPGELIKERGNGFISIGDELSLPFDANSIHIWKRYVRDFRQNHHFSLFSGGGRGDWRVGHFGGVASGSYRSIGVIGKLRYSYHVQIYKKFGYFLGTSFGYFSEIADKTKAFVPSPALHYPGLLAGLAINFTPGLRALLGVDFYLERLEHFKERDVSDPDNTHIISDSEVGLTMTTIDFMAAFDFFFNLNWALRAEVHNRRSFYEKPRDVDGLPVDVSISKSDSLASLGIVYHLL
ncbi:MAG: hypothetical protein R3B45_18400 [Bdellovibrionota bacterium]